MRSTNSRKGGGLARRAALALLLAALCGCSGPEAPPLAEGQAFPPFMLDEVLGAAASRPVLQGKTLVLNIWASWCVPCRKEMPDLQRLSQALDPRRFAVVGLATDDDARLAVEFLEQSGVTFANFFDRSGKMSKQLGLKGYPETFVIAPDGTLLRRMSGARDWNSAAMLALLQRIGQEPRGADGHP